MVYLQYYAANQTTKYPNMLNIQKSCNKDKSLGVSFCLHFLKHYIDVLYLGDGGIWLTSDLGSLSFTRLISLSALVVISTALLTIALL